MTDAEKAKAEFKKLSFTATRASGEAEKITLPMNKIHPWRIKGTIPKVLPTYWIFIGTYAEMVNPYENDKIVCLISKSVSVTQEEYIRIVNEINSSPDKEVHTESN